MATTLTVRDGVIVLPADLRDRYGLADGSEVIAEAGAGGILLRPVDQSGLPEVEPYTPERKAEFLLNNALDDAASVRARDDVTRIGLDLDQIPHAQAAREVLDEIGEALREQGLTLEDMIERGRAIREQLFEERYGSGTGAATTALKPSNKTPEEFYAEITRRPDIRTILEALAKG